MPVPIVYSHTEDLHMHLSQHTYTVQSLWNLYLNRTEAVKFI